mmetsp:Transcript_20969/g.58045  ORF Transcript_20969/g.58045 Transcript_20969/m.58045 type:complete len:97 (-) Transcript_20969:354-644(-)
MTPPPRGAIPLLNSGMIVALISPIGNIPLASVDSGKNNTTNIAMDTTGRPRVPSATKTLFPIAMIANCECLPLLHRTTIEKNCLRFLGVVQFFVIS